jgi:hypothetical protein
LSPPGVFNQRGQGEFPFQPFIEWLPPVYDPRLLPSSRQLPVNPVFAVIADVPFRHGGCRQS